METFSTNYESPLGIIAITATTDRIVELSFADQALPVSSSIPGVLKACVREVDAYFQGALTEFSVNLEPGGTSFQKRVWRQLQKIPYARTVSYGHVAREIGRPTACRAVGGANGRNPIAIIIPCHRVIGSNGTLTGYGSGLWRKEWLLEHEKKIAGAAT